MAKKFKQAPSNLILPSTSSYIVFRKVGIPEDLRKNGAFLRKPFCSSMTQTTNPEISDGWRFGCQWAGRGNGINRTYSIIDRKEMLIHEAPHCSSYAPIVLGKVEGDFPVYKRLERLASDFKPLATAETQNMIEGILSDIAPPVLITGGHYMPYLRNPALTRSGPIGTLDLALRIAKALHERGGRGDIGILVNDLHMLAGDEQTGNPIRASFWDSYQLPHEFVRLIRNYIDANGALGVFVIGERSLYNRLAHARASDKPDLEQLAIVLNSYRDDIKTKCVGALVYFLKFMLMTLGYKTIIQIYPTCDIHTREAVGKTMNVYKMDHLDPRLYFVYTTLGC